MVKLTKGQKEILEKMLLNKDNDEGELVYENGICCIGCERIDSRILFGLLRICAISINQYSEVDEFERYTINETGEKYLTN